MCKAVGTVAGRPTAKVPMEATQAGGHTLSSKAGRENGNGFVEKVRLKMSLKR